MNGPQLRAALMFCKTEFHLLSRGVGKTEGVIAPRTERLIHLMPQSTGAFVTRTFRQALTNTLPPVIRGWNNLGYIEEIHFVVGKRPPEHFVEPHTKPRDYKYCISWYNGTVIHLLSQDRPGSANGLSIDWIVVDEAKFINREKFDAEIVPANRGNRHLYGHLSCHHSIMYCSDRWYGSEALWIDELEQKVTHDQNRLIEALSIESENLKLNLLNKEYSDSYKDKIRARINNLEKNLNELRSTAVYFSYASAIENLTVLGIDYLKEQEEALPMSMFLVTVLNERRKGAKSPFYPHLDRKYHCYNSFNNELLDYHNQSIDCQSDEDLLPGKPLYIAIDPGAVINTMVIAQFDDKGNIRVINTLYVKKPSKTYHLIEKFCDYYEKHDCKKVVYYYNHTHTADHGATEVTYHGIITKILKKNKWNYADVYFPAVMEPKERYQLTSSYLERNEDGPRITFNEINCEFLLISMEDADTEEHKGMLRKDKSSERSKTIPQERATHFSDAFDDLLVGMDQVPHPTFSSMNIQVTTG